MNISLTLKHQSNQVDALAKIADLVDQLSRETFPQVTIRDRGHKLEGNTYKFWFTGQKANNTMMVTGTIAVTPTDVILVLTLPDVVQRFEEFDEAKVKQVITERFNALFTIK